jgi:hypothetical protein
MNKVVNLFNGINDTDQKLDTPDMLINRVSVVAEQYDKALVIMINDRAGVWDTQWNVAGLSNSETLLALEIVQRLIMDTVLGK